MLTMGYRYKPRFRHVVDADVAAAELMRIKQQFGAIIPSDVVDESRAEVAILHPHFDWDDATAAESYRCVQAQELIRSLVVVVDRGDDRDPVETRAFVNVVSHVDESEEDVRGWLDVSTALGTPALREQLLAQAQRDIEAFERKYAVLEELAPLWPMLRDALRPVAV